ncbi:FAD-binding domain-containing protein [Fomitopsis serialis]|uniref:FAD-binding domain-containing protein n=1 Tax=Fomitopsis serialis TaxID=139415 RepID=UPI002008427D|nr:FAD-binding domain-containing protein [Neoantrodia serialis]KAH9930868.1 FAD-binding domain-containing protein [Neoantrodia serialis]
MRPAVLYVTLPAVLSLVGTSYAQPQLLSRDVSTVCEEIAAAISSESDIYYPSTLQYTAANFHWLSSSTQQSTCTVEPGNVEDVGAVLKVLGENQTPFGVGHFDEHVVVSSQHLNRSRAADIRPTRVLINARGRGRDVALHERDLRRLDGNREYRRGNIWDDVYSALEPYSVNVVGGRVTGVGVAGFTLGGGFSFKTNEYGLTIDTVKGFELVLSNGTATNVTASTNPDLFFALKGGFNNFGIVTTFYLEAYTQSQVWGGAILISGTPSEVVVATQNFYDNVTDPKAAILTTINNEIGIPITELTLFYNAPTPPAGMFDEFLAIPAISTDISTRSYLSLVTSTPANATQTERGYFHSVSLFNLTIPLLNAIVNETTYWAETLALQVPGLFVSYDVEPFLPTYLSHGSDSAWPPSRATGLLPLNIYYSWWYPESDALVNRVMLQSAEYLTQFAVSQGQDVADVSLYPNYAIWNTTVERLYGGNLARLQSIKAEYDPNNVMALAGGWKF